MPQGALVISLDFELHWGVRDHLSIDDYRDNLAGARIAVPEILKLFGKHNIAATWATVGMLFAETKKELIAAFPNRRPNYINPVLSPYNSLSEVGEDETSDPFHFAPTLIREIIRTPRQELATHTFSHFYCLEDGQTEGDFKEDIEAAARIGARFGNVCRSIVFPRNQFNPAYLDVLRCQGVSAYRSNGLHWAYTGRNKETQLRRAYRLLDTYIPLRGSQKQHLGPVDSEKPIDIPASAFLRPYQPQYRHLEHIRLYRITSAMTAAAQSGSIYHLWWHPHNFGTYTQENMMFLTHILNHFEMLHARYHMESLAMCDVACVDC